MTWALEQAYATANRLKERAEEDTHFRRLLLSDPEEAVLRLTGEPLPEGTTLVPQEGEHGELTIAVQGVEETAPTGEWEQEPVEFDCE